MKDQFYRSPLKKLIRNFLGQLGLEIINLHVASTNLIHHHLRFIFSKYRIQAIIDVGANVGGYGFSMLNDCKFNGHLYSFEPVKSSFDILHRVSSKYPKWKAYKLAIGTEDCVKSMNLMKGHVLNSFLEPKEQSPDMTKVGTEIVQVKTLSYVRGLLNDDDLDFRNSLLKLDTQGYDFEIIRANIEDVIRFPTVLVEMAALDLYEGAMHIGQFLSYLKNAGFDPTGIFPVSSDQWGRVRDFDCVFVNRNLLDSESKLCH